LIEAMEAAPYLEFDSYSEEAATVCIFEWESLLLSLLLELLESSESLELSRFVNIWWAERKFVPPYVGLTLPERLAAMPETVLRAERDSVWESPERDGTEVEFADGFTSRPVACE
jgi:hypothetical protein